MSSHVSVQNVSPLFPDKFPIIATDVLMGLTFASFGSIMRGPEDVEDLRFLAMFVVGVRVGSQKKIEKSSAVV